MLAMPLFVFSKKNITYVLVVEQTRLAYVVLVPLGLALLVSVILAHDVLVLVFQS